MKKSSLILIGAVVLAFLSCTPRDRAQREQVPLRVKTMVVTPQEENAIARYVGTVEPVHETPLSMQSAGRVVAVNVGNGQRVRAGQTLLTIDNTQALNALNTAEASFRHAQDGYDRVKKVHDKGVVSDQKMVEVESRLAQARSVYDAARQQLKECTLVAPCDGVVDGLKVEPGQTLIPGAQLCRLLDLSGFSVRFSVPEAEMVRLKAEKGILAGHVECSATDTVLPVVVSEKSVTANPLTHTYDVVAEIKGGADVLMNGMVAVVKINRPLSANRPSELVIPAHCVLLKPEGSTLWVVEQGTAVRRLVTVGGYTAGGVRIIEGLQPGDTLIIDGFQKLYKGCKVTDN